MAFYYFLYFFIFFILNNSLILFRIPEFYGLRLACLQIYLMKTPQSFSCFHSIALNRQQKIFSMDGLIIGFRPHAEKVKTTYLHVHVTIIGFGRDSDYSHF